MTNIPFKIGDGWALFLDRDGVINRNLPNDYVKRWNEFEFLPTTLEGLKKLRKLFSYLIIFSNQQGVGKGIMSSQDVERVHQKMLEVLADNGVTIDAVYWCPHLDAENCECRKPKIGMIEQAKKDFPELDLTCSLMVGDKISDMQFGRNAGCKTLIIQKADKQVPIEADFSATDLLALANQLMNPML